MADAVVMQVGMLGEHALDAAARFHGEWTAKARAELSGGAGALTIVLAPAPFDHADWRRAAARDLARAHTDARVNIVAGDDPAAIDAACAFLADAPGITGQYLELDGFGAGNPSGLNG